MDLSKTWSFMHHRVNVSKINQNNGMKLKTRETTNTSAIAFIHFGKLNLETLVWKNSYFVFDTCILLLEEKNCY